MKKVLKVNMPLYFGYWTGEQGDLSSDIRKAVILEDGDDDTAMMEAYDWFEASCEDGEEVHVVELPEERFAKMLKWANENL